MIEYSTFTLDNGLRVVHSYDPQTPMAVCDVLYATGARDEDPSLTGLAHLFEHLMFSCTYGGESYDNVLELAGGSSNAATGNDFTEFYEILPCQNIETAFFLESGRMLSLDPTQKALDVQKGVVIEEFKQVCLNSPYGRLMHALRPMLYDKHPYRWPVIGVEPEHIAKVTLDDVHRWHRDHYAPNNAVLSVVGNVTLERVKELAEKWFGPIPRRDTPLRNFEDDPWLLQPRRKVVTENVPQTMIAIAYRMDEYGAKEYFAADAITDILSAGKSSRLYQRLAMGTDLFTSVNISIMGSEHSGFMLATANVTKEDDASIRRAEGLLIDECRKLAELGDVTPYELERTKNRYESTFTFENVASLNLAQTLAMSTLHGEDINENVPRYRSLTLEDIASTAKRIFIDHAPAILYYRPS